MFYFPLFFVVVFFKQMLILWNWNVSYICNVTWSSSSCPSPRPWHRTVTWQQRDRWRWWGGFVMWTGMAYTHIYTHTYTHMRVYINRYSVKTGGTITTGSKFICQQVKHEKVKKHICRYVKNYDFTDFSRWNSWTDYLWTWTKDGTWTKRESMTFYLSLTFFLTFSPIFPENHFKNQRLLPAGRVTTPGLPSRGQ